MYHFLLVVQCKVTVIVPQIKRNWSKIFLSSTKYYEFDVIQKTILPALFKCRLSLAFKFYYSLISKCKASRILNDFIYSLTRQKMKAKVLIKVEIGLEENSSNKIKENTKESDFRQLNLVLDSLEIITSLQEARILFFSMFFIKFLSN